MSSLGQKRDCPHCDAKFYDLNKNPIVCPKCGGKVQPGAGGSRKKRVKRTEDKASKKKPLEKKKKKAKKPVEDELGGLDLSGFEDAEEDVEVKGEEIDPIDEDENLESLTDLEEREREEEGRPDDEGDEEALIEGLKSEDIFDPAEEEDEYEDEEDEDESDEDTELSDDEDEELDEEEDEDAPGPRKRR